MTHLRINYEEKSFKSRTEEFKNLKAAQEEIAIIAHLWSRNGGQIIKSTKNKLVVSEADNSETITYQILKY